MSDDAQRPAETDGPERAALAGALLDWYGRERRDLPWRRTSDPWAVWVSEAMLQQTRVETVVPYWERFLARFPGPAALARAGDDELLAAWSGLGYYRRARALRDAAARVAELHGGRFPRDLEQALALPGVGPYTARAVLSIAYDERFAVVDGNVLRVLARVFGLEAPLGSTALAREVARLADALVPPPDAPGSPRGPGAFNQAVMELGATVCTPREPRCGACPLSAACRARAAGRTAELPVPGRREEPLDVALEVLVVARAGELLLERRGEGGRMAGMLQCPTREVVAPGGSARLFPAELPRLPAGRLVPRAPLASVRHAITRHRIEARVLAGEVRGDDAPEAGGALAWTPVEGCLDRALTGMTRKVLRRVEVARHVGARAERA